MPNPAPIPPHNPPNLENARKRAKTLLKACRAGDAAALARLAGPRHSPATNITLADAQRVIAREAGFATWAELLHASAAALAPLVPSPVSNPLPKEEPMTNQTASQTGQVSPEMILAAVQALRDGDLTQRLPTDGEGTLGEIARTLNAHFHQMAHFTREQIQIAREMSAGKFGGQSDANLRGVWRDQVLTLNEAAALLCTHVRNMSHAIGSLAAGDLSAEWHSPAEGEIKAIRDRYNVLLFDLRRMKSEISRVAHEIGTAGRLGGQALVPEARGQWRELVDGLNLLAHRLTSQIRNMGALVSHIERGARPTWKVEAEMAGEVAELRDLLHSIAEKAVMMAPAPT